MFNLKEGPIVLSIGGSLIVPPGGINTTFLSNLNKFIRTHVAAGRRFLLVAGGGATARKYIDGGRGIIGDITDEDLDWLGIHSTRLNAHLLRTIFMDIAHPRIIENYNKKLRNWREPLAIGAGWKPGWSTDYDAVVLARDYNANLIINLSNIDAVYDKDPKIHKDARPIEKITWEELEQFVGTKWVPGSNVPFDPIASRLARELKATVVVTNGNDFENLQKIMEGDKFKGTVITPFTIDASFYDREYYTSRKGGTLFAYANSTRGQVLHNLTNFYRAAVIKLFLNPKNCLDVGCGTGYLVRWLRFFGIDAIGVEISKAALELADEKIRPHLKRGDITRLSFGTNQFDLVLSFDVLDHVDRSKIRRALDETIRVSKKYILHKIQTKENVWTKLFHRRDFSSISVFSNSYWRKAIGEIKKVDVVNGSFLKLPTFFETVFLLRKK